MSYCGEQSAVKREQAGITAVSLRCRSWTCSDCYDGRKRQLVAQALGGSPCTFLTLTSRRRPGMTANEAAKKLSWCWRIIRLRLMRKFKWKALPFLAVCEATKRGWPHLHILLRSKYIPWQTIQKWMRELHDSPHIRIERITKESQVAGYCAKYCGKCAHKFGTAKRYWQSRDYDLREPQDEKPSFPPGWGWEIRMDSLHKIVRGWEEVEWEITWISAHRVFAVPILPGAP